MEWSRADILKLIKLYRQYECLWNFDSSDYKQMEFKKIAWQEIARELKKDVKAVKKKIKHLRTAYIAEKKKVDSKKKSDSPEECIYEPNLFYFNEMSFLNSVVVLRRTLHGQYAIENCELIIPDPLSVEEKRPKANTSKHIKNEEAVLYPPHNNNNKNEEREDTNKKTQTSIEKVTSNRIVSTAIADIEIKCRLELHQLQKENEKKRGRNLDLEHEILLLKLKKLKEM